MQGVHTEDRVELSGFDALGGRIDVDVVTERPQIAAAWQHLLDRPDAAAEESRLQLCEDVVRGGLVFFRQGVEEGKRRAPAAASDLEHAGAGPYGSLDGQGGNLIVRCVVRVRVGEVVEPESHGGWAEERILTAELAFQDAGQRVGRERKHLVGGTGGW